MPQQASESLTFESGPRLKISPELQIHGLISSTGVANFLGIPYATIPDRFRQSRLLAIEELGDKSDGVIDATEYGPICPQPLDPAFEHRRYLYKGARPLLQKDGSIAMDAGDCLRLNIHVPPEALRSKDRKLPVFVWIHGGGWIMGNGNSMAEGNYLVQKAVQIGKPIISVGINYRLGFHGFLSSKELEEEAAQNGEVYFANKGMVDQRNALLWIRDHIHHFGGDGNNVTIAGESAGGWCVFAHLLSNIPVCRRGIIQSSVVFSFKAPEASQKTFDRIVLSAGVSPSAPTAEKLKALRSLSDSQLEELRDGCFTRPIWDPNWFVYQNRYVAFEEVSAFAPWVEGVVMGWTRDEMALFHPEWKNLSPGSIRDWISKAALSSQFAQELVTAYHMHDDKKTLSGLIRLTTDSIFASVPLLVARRITSPPISVYRFDKTDDFPQSLARGYSYHSLDTAFVRRGPAVAGPGADPGYRDTANNVSECWVDFVCGQQPWEPFNRENGRGKVMLLDSRKNLVKWPVDEVAGTLEQFIKPRERASWFTRMGEKMLIASTDHPKLS